MSGRKCPERPANRLFFLPRLADFSPQRQRACAKRATSHASMFIGNQIGAAGSSLGLRAEAEELGNKSQARITTTNLQRLERLELLERLEQVGLRWCWAA
jgi:hypothetical protein